MNAQWTLGALAALTVAACHLVGGYDDFVVASTTNTGGAGNGGNPGVGGSGGDTGGNGGDGGTAPCTTEADCPGPTTACLRAACVDQLCTELPNPEGTECEFGTCTADGQCVCGTNDDCTSTCGNGCICVASTSCVDPYRWATGVEPFNNDSSSPVQSLALRDNGDLVFSVFHTQDVGIGTQTLTHALPFTGQISIVTLDDADGSHRWHANVNPVQGNAQIGVFGNGELFMAGVHDDIGQVQACRGGSCRDLEEWDTSSGFVATFTETTTPSIYRIASASTGADVEVDAVSCLGNCYVVGTYAESFVIREPPFDNVVAAGAVPPAGTRGGFIIAYEDDLTIDWVRWLNADGGFGRGNGPHSSMSVIAKPNGVYVAFDFEGPLGVTNCVNFSCTTDPLPQPLDGDSGAYGVVRFDSGTGDANLGFSSSPATTGRKPMAATNTRVAMVPNGEDVTFANVTTPSIDTDCVIASVDTDLTAATANLLGGPGAQLCHGQAFDGHSLLTAFANDGTAELSIGPANIVATHTGRLGIAAWNDALDALNWSTTFAFTDVDPAFAYVAAHPTDASLGSALSLVGKAEVAGGTIRFSDSVSYEMTCTRNLCGSAIVRLAPIPTP